jgi:hypothetical protein
MVAQKTTFIACVVALGMVCCAPVMANTIGMVLPGVTVTGYDGALGFTGVLGLSGRVSNSQVNIGSAVNPADLLVSGQLEFRLGSFQSGSILVTDMDSGATYNANVASGRFSGNIFTGMQFIGVTDEGWFDAGGFAGLTVSDGAGSNLTGTIDDGPITYDYFNPSPGPPEATTTLRLTVDDPVASLGAHAPVPSAVALGMMLLLGVGVFASRGPRKCRSV